ncbi:MAG: hypothetical protein AAF602_18510, partial [Myxococcota bacterium]
MKQRRSTVRTASVVRGRPRSRQPASELGALHDTVGNTGLTEWMRSRGHLAATDVTGTGGDTRQPAVRAHEAVHRQQFERGLRGGPHASERALEDEAQRGSLALLSGVPFRARLAAPPTAMLAYTPSTRDGERWPGGPVTELKSRVTPLANYVAWVEQVESVLGDDEATIRALRRLYYSKRSGAAVGKKFDNLIAPPRFETPMLSSPRVPPAVLDGLYATKAITTPRGDVVDVSHLLANLDLRLSGRGYHATGAMLRFGIDWSGAVTWLGDLASWFVEWNHQRRKAEQSGEPWPEHEHLPRLMAMQPAKVDIDDLLADLDAQVLASEYTSTDLLFDGVTPAVRIPKADLPLSRMLDVYYGGAGGPSVRGTDAERFHHFVAASKPPIPHQKRSRAPDPLRVELAPSAHDFV